MEVIGCNVIMCTTCIIKKLFSFFQFSKIFFVFGKKTNPYFPRSKVEKTHQGIVVLKRINS